MPSLACQLKQKSFKQIFLFSNSFKPEKNQDEKNSINFDPSTPRKVHPPLKKKSTQKKFKKIFNFSNSFKWVEKKD